MNDLLKSIFDIRSTNIHGRVARSGFDYQDHVGVSLILEMLENSEIIEIWFETHDDMDLIKRKNGKTLVEFIQVKHEDKSSRYSIASLTHRKNGKEGTSLFEKSLNQAKCSEDVQFRLVTSYDVDNNLSILKVQRGQDERKGFSEKEEKILEEINKRCPGVTAENKVNAKEWIKKCFWDKKSDSKDDLKARNIRLLSKVIQKLFSQPIYSGHVEELYQIILSKVKKASTEDLKINPGINEIMRTEFIEWLQEKIDELNDPKGASKKLEEKMTVADIKEDYIKNAKSLKQKYMQKRYDSDFLKSGVLSDFEGEIIHKLYSLKISLDDGELNDDGPAFHKRCKGEVEALVLKERFKAENVPEYLANGCMYSITNRCIHRFSKVES